MFFTMVIKKTQEVSSSLFMLGRKISDVAPGASNALENFPIFLTIDFPQMLDALGKWLKFHINV